MFSCVKIGGEISTCVPDTSIYIKAYINNSDLDPYAWLRYTTPADINSKIDYVIILDT